MPNFNEPERAEALNDRGNELRERGLIAEAERAYLDAAAADPRWSVPHYNLGLLYKYEGRWRESVVENRAALALDPEDESAWWNLGIAATAVADWTTARAAWNGCGIPVPDGDGPLDMKLGLVPIRLLGEQREVVWSRRVDPARAIVMSVPLPQSGHAWGDEVLHDGAANGHRTYRGREVPVFDELQVLRRSGYRTYEVELETGDPEELQLLEETADELDGGAEDWSQSVRHICKQCSEGRPAHEHDEELRDEPGPTVFAVAARSDEHLDRILAAWAKKARTSMVKERRCVATAGKLVP